MQEWQKRIRQEAERVAGQLKMVQINLPDMDRVVGLMKQTEQAYAEGRYGDLFRLQQMILQHLRMTGDTVAREVALRVERAYQLPPDQRRRILDSLSEPVPTVTLVGGAPLPAAAGTEAGPTGRGAVAAGIHRGRMRRWRTLVERRVAVPRAA